LILSFACFCRRCLLSALSTLSLIPVQVVELEQDLGVRDFHIAEPVKHLFDALEALSISHSRFSALKHSLDLIERLSVLLHDK
jgi:hypothetical protein